MFGEYAQIATYLPSSRDSSGAGDFPASTLPSHLLPSPAVSQPLWVGGGFSRKGRGQENIEDLLSVEDFVMVAEFSEIEGPKPVLTIPKDAGSNIDQNALSVKLMAVDHQTSSEGFSISEDTQVVLSDDESGVSAFVHHFVLYDNQARGFVRPYCMVFISTDIRKILMFYEEISSQFKRAARFLKYGNRLLFVKDLERHLQDLEHTKGYLLNQVGRMRLKDNQGPDSEQIKSRSNAENELYKGLQNIRQSTTEIRDILSILKPLLHDRRLESRFRVLEERAYQRGSEEQARAEKLSLQEDWFADNIYADNPSSGTNSGSLKDSVVSPVSLFTSAPSHTPLLVETKKAKRFNSPLRGLHELCSWGAKEGLRKLRCIHEYFKKDAMVLELERNESSLMEPTNSMMLHGHCVTSNVLAGVKIRGSSLCLSEDSSSILLSSDKLRRWPSIASDDTLESFKSVDSYLSLQDDENASLFSFASNNSSTGVTTTSASAQDFLSAPTSPMTEEVAFPPAASSHATQHTDVMTDGATSQPPDTTAKDSSSFSIPYTTADLASAESSSILLSSADPTQSHSNVESVAIDTKLKPSHDSSATQLLTDETPTGVNATESQHTWNSLSGSQQNQSHDDIKSHSLQNGRTKVREISTIGNSASAIEDNDSSVSETTEILCQAPVVNSAVNGLPDSGVSCLNLGADFLQMSDEEALEKGSSELPVSRLPSFVPFMPVNLGQHIRAAQNKQSANSRNSPSSPEKSLEGSPRNLDRLKMEFTDSFKSVSDSVSQIGTDDGCCDMESGATDSVYNLLAASTPSSESCLWKPRNGIYTVGDVINSLGPGRPGHGIHEILSTYGSLQPVVLSLLTGRTVLVVGPAKMEPEVTKVVTALSIFLPDTKRKQHCVVDWMNRPLKVTDLTRIQLAGICRSEKRSLEATIPIAVKQYSTVMDVERRVIVGPAYQGTLLNSVLQQKKSFKTDAQHVAYIHSWLMEISNKAFIFYHSFCLGEAGGLTLSPSVEKHREQYNATVCSLMNRLGVRDHDITIVEHLAEKVKLSQLESHIWSGVDKGSVIYPLAISSRGNHTFRC